MNEIFQHQRQVAHRFADGRHVKVIVHKEGIEQVGQKDEAGGHIAQAADGARQAPKTQLQWAFPGFLLHLLGHIPIKGAVAHAANPHDALAGGDGAALEKLIGPGQIPLLGRAAAAGALFGLAALPVQGGLIHRQPAGKQHLSLIHI